MGSKKWIGELATAEIVKTIHGDKYLGKKFTGNIQFDRKIGTYIILGNYEGNGSKLRTTMIEHINGDIFKTRNTSYRVQLVSEIRKEKLNK